MGIRPEDVRVVEQGIPGEVYLVEPLGRDDLIDVRIGNLAVRVLADPELNLAIGQSINLEFNTQKVQFFDPKTERSLLW
jgi:ABC-type sugar transport system ATPase subunit